MKKLFIIGVAALAIMLFASMQVYSGANCTGKTTCTKAEKAACTGTKAQMTSAEHAAKCGMSPEECAKVCGGVENCGFTEIDIKGMTCVDCEKSVTAALEAVPGVIKVVKVDHKEGKALVCTNSKTCTGESLTKAVTDKGFQATIMPAVATSSDAPKVMSKTGCAPGCSKTCTGMKKTCGTATSGCGSKKADTEKKSEGI